MSNVVDVILIDDKSANCDYFATSLDYDCQRETLHFRIRGDLNFARDPTAVVDALFAADGDAIGRIVLLDLHLGDGHAGRALEALTRRGLLAPALAAGKWPVGVIEENREALALGAALLQERRAIPTMILTATSLNPSAVTEYLKPQHFVRLLATQLQERCAELQIDRGLEGYVDDRLAARRFVGNFGDSVDRQTHQNLARAYAAFVNIFHVTSLASVSASDWRRIRKDLWNLSTELAQSRQYVGLKDELWAHHLPGGSFAVEQEYAAWFEQVYPQCLGVIRNTVPTVNQMQLPVEQFKWSTSETVPWRAVTQFDGHGRDFTSALETLNGYCSCAPPTVGPDKRVRIRVTALTEHPEGNCLWSNALDFVEQLRSIADHFCDYLREKDGIGSIDSARFNVDVRFEGSAVRMKVVQEAVLDDGAVIPIVPPSPGTAACYGNIERAYGALIAAGADLKVEEGALVANIEADIEGATTFDSELANVWWIPESS